MKRKLSRREKIAVSLASIVVVALLILEAGVFPLVRHRKQTARRIEAQTAALSEVQALKREYEVLKIDRQRLDTRLMARKDGFSLFSLVESLAGRTGVKPHIAYLKPSSGRQGDGGRDISQVEMQLKEIDLEQLVRYLYALESAAELVYVNRLSISKSGNTAGKIDVVLQVESIES